MENIVRKGNIVIMEHPETQPKEFLSIIQLFDTSFILQSIFCCLFSLDWVVCLFVLILGKKSYGNKLNIFVCAVYIQTVNSQQRSE